jgi:hypothetical protein
LQQTPIESTVVPLDSMVYISLSAAVDAEVVHASGFFIPLSMRCNNFLVLMRVINYENSSHLSILLCLLKNLIL